jgi:hypothetical protein
LSICIIASLTFFGLGYAYNQGYFHKSPQLKANLYVFRETLGGRDVIATGNVVTDSFENWTASWLGLSGSLNTTARNATQWISFGNASVSQTLTKLTTEATAGGFERALGTVSELWMSSSDASYNVTVTVTATATTTINAVGVHTSGVSDSDSNMVACGAITQSEFPTGSNCTALWIFTLDFN